MKQTTKRFMSMIVGLALIVGAMMLYFQFIKPVYDDSQQVKSQQVSQRLFLLNEQDTIKRVQDLISSYQTQGELQQAISLALPAKEDVSGGLAQLYGLARASGVNFESASISVGALRGAAEAAAQEEPQFAPSFALQKPLGTVTYRVKITGPYVNLKSFLELLETNIRIFDLESLSLTPVGPAGAGTLFSYEMAVTTYYQRPE
ncbi:MAG: hypothetical protein AAB897_04085 [Patescibacteria group bacterium]